MYSAFISVGDKLMVRRFRIHQLQFLVTINGRRVYCFAIKNSLVGKMNDNYEFGGYLPLDIRTNDFFSSYPAENIMRFNAARYAALYAVLIGKYDKVWIPFYMCPSVMESFKSHNINVAEYHIDTTMEPSLEGIDSESTILIPNYFGIKDIDFYHRMVEKFTNVIFDNTQAFFATPVMKKNVYNIYSPRKFIGVPDGGYLIGSNLNSLKGHDIKKSVSSNTSSFLLLSLEHGPNYAYKEYLENEDRISMEGMAWMSDLTYKLCTIPDYHLIQRKRIENYNYLIKRLKNVNAFELKDVGISEVPFVYPFFMKNYIGFREYLINNKIYVPQWWRKVLEEPINQWERSLCNGLFPLAIDQRYDEDDLETVVGIIESF